MPAGGNSRFRGYPARMSERQQLALLLQMTSQEMTSGSSGARSESNVPLSNSRSSPLQRSSKSRWSNKNSDLTDVNNASFNRQEERLRLAHGCDSKEQNEFAGSISPDEVRTASRAESPVAAGSPAECAATVISAQRQQQQQQQVSEEQDNVSSSSSTLQQLEHEDGVSGASYEMRRTPPQNKVDRQAAGGGSSSSAQQQTGGNASGTSVNTSGNSGNNSTSSSSCNSGNSNSPRVTLRLNQVRATRDDKKGTVGSAAVSGSSTTSTATGANAPTSTTRQSSGSSVSMSSSQMEASSTKSSSGSVGGTSISSTSTICTSSGPVSSQGTTNNSGNNAGANNNSSSSSSVDGGDVYEFKSSKEATPVRGSSSSPNPNPEKDTKDSNSSSIASSTSITTQSQNVSGTGAAVAATSNAPSIVGSTTTSSSASVLTSSAGNIVGSSNPSSGTGSGGTSSESPSTQGVSSVSDEPMLVTTSPASAGSATSSTSTKRAFDSESGQGDDQDEEVRKRKKKDNNEPSNKEVGTPKGAAGNRQTAGRNNPGVADKCAKSGKQTVGAMSAKSNQSNVSTNSERKSPSASLSANSPKPSNPSSSLTSNIPKGTTSASTESDGEDERSKNTDSNSAPKVPPLKIVIPQSTTSEQEQGNRNGKNPSTRGHQLPYVVASSNSNDSMDKDQSMSTTTGGTTSPLDNSGVTSKSDDKKDFSGALDNESRSMHHQRVLRSSHRSGNGGNGTSSGRESASNISGNGNYSNSSPLPTNSADRSNNSSPQQRHHSPTPESSNVSETGKSASTDSTTQNSPAVKSNNSTEKSEKSVDVKKETGDSSESNTKKETSSEASNSSSQNVPVELHPRKRKMKSSKEAQQAAAAAAAAAATAASETTESASTGPEIHPHDQPITNCYQLFLNIRKQIERRRKGLFPVQPKPPQGFKDYLMNRCTYVLAGNANKEPNINPPASLNVPMKDLYVEQEKERYRLRMQHVVEKEKLVLSVEQEILRVHGRAARALANQSLPFSVCTILKDEEVYNVITPEQEEKDRNARSRYNGRLFLSWLQDVDDKWEKIKESMLLRHHNEAESLHAVQRMDWEWKLKEVGLCEFKATPQIEELHVPMVHVSDDFDLLPA